MIGKLLRLWRDTCFNPYPLWRTLHVNFLRSHTERVTRSAMLLFTRFTPCDVHPSAVIRVGGHSVLGFKKYRGSRLETSLWMDRNATLEIGSELGGSTVYHGCDIQIFGDARVRIGGRCVMNRGAQIICQEEISIGNGCLISRDVVIRDNDGGHTVLTEGYKKTEPVHVGDHVWIGQGAVILKGTTIGDGAIIGAGAVVSGRVKPKALVMADPSRTFAKDVEWKE